VPASPARPKAEGGSRLKRPVTSVIERVRARSPWAPSGILRALVTVRNVVIETYHGFRADRGIDLAASLAFTTLLTAVPMLAAFSLVIATFFKENVATILDLVNFILPYHTARVTDNLREFISESTAISGIGLAVLLITSLRLIFIVEEIVNAVWGAPRRRRWFSRLAIHTCVLVALGMLVGGIALGIRAARSFSMGETIFSSAAADQLFPLMVEFTALTILYKYLPNARVRWTSAAAAGFSVAVALEILRWLFGLYVKALGRVNLITGSLTLVLLTLLSVYLVWVLILLGVELTHVLQIQAGRHRTVGGPRAGRAENAIRMLLSLAAGGRYGLRELYVEQEASSAEAEKVLGCLRDSGLVEGDAVRGYALARPARKITVAEVVDAISPNLYTITPEENDRVVEVLAPLFERLDSERRALLGTTIADLKK